MLPSVSCESCRGEVPLPLIHEIRIYVHTNDDYEHKGESMLCISWSPLHYTQTTDGEDGKPQEKITLLIKTTLALRNVIN